MKKLLVIALFFFTLFTFAQEQTFIYSRNSGIINLVTASDTLTLKDYRKTKDKIRNREAIIGGETYTLSIAKIKGGPIQTFIDPQGVTQATVNLGNRNRYDITLVDGSVLDCKITGRKWTYTKDGKEVMKASMKRVDGKKTILVSNLDPQVATPVVLLSCLERGTDKYVSASTTAPLIITGVMLGIIRAVVSSSQPDYY